jgi:mannosylglycerate hydrolase
MHLILNTHWDREFRWSFRETQMRLIEAVDLLIEIMEKDPRFTYFHTDSQVSFLDDYLEIRPENKDRIIKLVSEGRILTGPWYTLPSEFMVSGEALVRNLLTGHRIANGLGKVMKAGYNIFSWGQVSQLPQIYRQFGMDTIMFYRGIDQSNLDKLEFWWEAPDGTRAMGITFGSYHRLNFWVYVYLPYIKGPKSLSRMNLGKDGLLVNFGDGYSDDINHHLLNQPCNADMEMAMAGMKQLLATVVDKSSTSHLLFLQGFDQENPDPVVPYLIELINKRIDYGQITVSDLPSYITAVRHELKESGKEKELKTFKGEMLSVEQSGDPFAPLYIGTFSARMPLKQLNSQCEYRLEGWAEPSSVWAMMRGKKYPEGPLHMAWKELLQNQQHDGIGGCHVDRVVPTMIERYNNARDISETVTRESLNAIVAEIDFSRLSDKEIGLVVFNSLSYSRSEVVTTIVDIPVEWGITHVPGTRYRELITCELYDASGKKIRCQVISQEEESTYAYLKYGSHFNFEVVRVQLAFEANDIPAMGYSCYTLRPKVSVDRPIDTLCPVRNVLENEFLRAEIKADGTIDMYDKASEMKYEGLHYFEDGGEEGGPLTYYPPNGDAIYTTMGQSANIALIKCGPLYASYRIERMWLLPESLELPLKIHVPHGHEWVDHGPLKRSSRKSELKIRTEVILRKGSRTLEFETTVENTIKDHRLRVLFPTNLSSVRFCRVDSPFDVPVREIAIPDSSGWYEAAARTLPSHSFIDVADEDRNTGLTVIHNGLPEYEVVDDATRTIAITLLRCFDTSGGPSETYIPQPLAQCPGTHRFRYAVGPHSAEPKLTHILSRANAFNIPMRIAQTTPHKGQLPMQQSFINVSPATFKITALKKAEQGDAIILRGYNPTDQTIAAEVSITGNLVRAEKVTLEEIKIQDLMIATDGKIQLPVGKGEIVSVALYLK